MAVIIAVYFIAASFNSPFASSIGKPVDPTLYSGLAGFSGATLADAGAGSAKAPTPINGSSLTLNGRPEVLYIGGEYCPYCAVTRWSMVIALSKFGNFTGLEYMLSSGTDPTNPNTPTFTFANSSYTSQYISLVTVEHWDRSDNTYQPLTAGESALLSQYDSVGNIPFIDFANQYLIIGAGGGLGAIDLGGMSWTQVYSQLGTASASTAQAILGEANYFISGICAIDGKQPASVCSASNGTLALAYTPPGASVSQPSLLVTPAIRLDTPWTV